MSNLLSDDFVRRLSRMLRAWEGQGTNLMGARDSVSRSRQPTVMAKITDNYGDGFYGAEEVRWEDDGINPPEWKTFSGGRVWDNTTPTERPFANSVLESSLIDNVDLETIVELQIRATHYPNATSSPFRRAQWVFQLGGGGSNVFPAKITGKITSGVGATGYGYYASVYENGVYEDDGSAKPVITFPPENAYPLVNQILYIWQTNTAYVVPSGTWVYAIQVDEHYEAQIPIWLC